MTIIKKCSNRNSYCGVTFNRKNNLYENEIIKVNVEFVRGNRHPKANLNFLPLNSGALLGRYIL